jgi:hypothetical protein
LKQQFTTNKLLIKPFQLVGPHLQGSIDFSFIIGVLLSFGLVDEYLHLAQGLFSFHSLPIACCNILVISPTLSVPTALLSLLNKVKTFHMEWFSSTRGWYELEWTSFATWSRKSRESLYHLSLPWLVLDPHLTIFVPISAIPAL